MTKRRVSKLVGFEPRLSYYMSFRSYVFQLPNTDISWHPLIRCIDQLFRRPFCSLYKRCNTADVSITIKVSTTIIVNTTNATILIKRGLKPWHDASKRTWPAARSMNNRHYQHDHSWCLLASFSREEAHDNFDKQQTDTTVLQYARKTTLVYIS